MNTWLTAIVLVALLLSMFSVAVSAADGLTMSTVYTGMSAKAGDAISYPLVFTNTGEGEEVELSIVSAPEGWEGYFFGNNTSHGWGLQKAFAMHISAAAASPLYTREPLPIPY